METKIIPFDIEIAKKIQAGEIKGRIKDKNGFEGAIITFVGANTPLPIVVKFNFPDGDNIFFVGNDGVSTSIELVLEVLNNEPKEPQFKPFDKVLARSEEGPWTCALFSHMTNMDDFPYNANNFLWKHCIPYEGNEYLVGTTDKPKEE